MSKKTLFLGVMALVAVLVAFGAWHESTPTRATAPPLPVQPFSPSFSYSGLDTTVLGAATDNLVETKIPKGQRISMPWIFSAPDFGIPLDMDNPGVVSDTVPKTGDIIATLDVKCDGNVTGLNDYLAAATSAAALPTTGAEPRSCRAHT